MIHGGGGVLTTRRPSPRHRRRWSRTLVLAALGVALSLSATRVIQGGGR